MEVDAMHFTGVPVGDDWWALECSTCGPVTLCRGDDFTAVAREHAYTHLFVMPLVNPKDA